jgi:hypothetical protein
VSHPSQDSARRPCQDSARRPCQDSARSPCQDSARSPSQESPRRPTKGRLSQNDTRRRPLSYRPLLVEREIEWVERK